MSKFIINNILDLYSECISSPHPVTNTTKDFFKRRKTIGANDRNAILNILYPLLKNRTISCSIIHSIKNESLENPFLNIDPKEEAKLSLALYLFNNHLEPKELISNELEAILKNPPPNLKEMLELPLPKYIFSRWNKFLKREFIIDLTKSFISEAPLDLRVHTFRTTIEDALILLKKDLIEATRLEYSRDGLRIINKVNLSDTSIFRHGLVEIHDEGSQIVSLVSNPLENMKILDVCAGAGGKTLHLATLMNNKGEVVAFDTDSKKLDELERRMIKAKLTNINIVHKISKLNGLFDLVLIDAPCSSSGTLRRAPEVLWKNLEDESIKHFSKKQLECLKTYNNFVKNGGSMIYATCSIEKAENEDVIEKFLSENSNFSKTNIATELVTLNLSKLTPHVSNGYLRLFPNTTMTDGFFIAKLKKHQ